VIEDEAGARRKGSERDDGREEVEDGRKQGFSSPKLAPTFVSSSFMNVTIKNLFIVTRKSRKSHAKHDHRLR